MVDCRSLLPRVYYPIAMGDTYQYFDNGVLVRMATLNGKDYPINLPPHTEYGGESTPADAYYLARGSLYFNPLRSALRVNPLSKSSPLYQEILENVDFVHRRFLEKKVVPKEEVEQLKAEFDQLELNRMIFTTVYNPETGEVKAVMGCYDGTPQPGVFRGAYGDILGQPTDSRIQIERKFPHLKLPERELGEDVHELIRTAVDDRMNGIIPTLLRGVAIMLKTKYGWLGYIPRRTAIYLVCPERHVDHYTRTYHFSVAYTPKELLIKENETQLYVLKIDLGTLIHHYLLNDQIQRW